MGPARSHRVVGLEGMGVNVNNGGTHPTFLWFASGGSAADAVVDIQVTKERQIGWAVQHSLTHPLHINSPQILVGDEAPPAGYHRLSENLAKGAPQSAFLAFKTAPQSDEAHPMCDLRLVEGDDTPGETTVFVCV